MTSLLRLRAAPPRNTVLLRLRLPPPRNFLIILRVDSVTFFGINRGPVPQDCQQCVSEFYRPCVIPHDLLL